MSDKVPMTVGGAETLKTELANLKKVERPKIIQEIATARAHGDLSENAEYHAAREKQSFIEGRIQLIEDKLARAEIIDTSTVPRDRVAFGVTVLVEDAESGEEVQYQIVGVDEANIEEKKISITSPLARGLIGKELDDLAEIMTPGGKKEYTVIDIL
ncbi:MAG: transcription elongation factor GreA [Nitrospinota bacterium]